MIILVLVLGAGRDRSFIPLPVERRRQLPRAGLDRQAADGQRAVDTRAGRLHGLPAGGLLQDQAHRRQGGHALHSFTLLHVRFLTSYCEETVP